jgi:hypothetical protein
MEKCIAIKYNGLPCPCRAKYGRFCGRHSSRCKECGSHFATQDEKDRHYCQTEIGTELSAPPPCIESNNFLWKLIFKYPGKEWEWRGISLNSCTTLDIIEFFINEPHVFKFYWDSVSMNPNLTPEFIKKHPYKKWDWRMISKNKAFSFKDVEDNPEFPWEPSYLVLNTSFSEKDIEKIIDKYSWQKNVWENHDLSLEFVKDHSRGKRLNWREIALNKNITPDFIEQRVSFLSSFMYWFKLSSSDNYNLTTEFFERHAEDHNWNLNFGSPIFDEKFIEKHAEEKWFWEEDEYGFRDELLSNPKVTVGLLKKYQKLQEINRYALSSRLRVTLEDVELNPDVDWNYNALCKNCKIPLEKIKESERTFYYIAGRCNNTEEFIEEYLDVTISCISRKNFNYFPKVQRMIRERQEIMEEFGIIRDISNLIITGYEGIKVRNWNCYYCDV